ncbi:MAG: AAA family ATPase [Erysipelotrichaceae bacterium]|nr:AAA family ATPase [Erysipelotrichaceae bacterium]MBR4610773.1 AAA family ATPase [Erysipelotrichaceae bacterium]
MDNNEEIEIIEGEFTHTIYKSDSYMVSKFKTDDGAITVTGPSFDYESGQRYVLSGTYVDHPRYGFQFSMLSVEKYISTRKEEILSLLKSSAFPGIGKKAAEKIYEHFGADTLMVLKDQPEKIYEVELSEKQFLSILAGFESMSDPQNEIILHLVSNGFNSNDAQKIFSRFKLATKEVGEDNPFRYYTEVYGVGFDKVKRYASQFEFDDAQNKYREAYLVHLISEYTFASGDMYLSYEKLLSLLEHYGRMENLDEILERCIEKQYLYRKYERIYLYGDYCDELYIADFLKSFNGGLNVENELVEEGIEEDENKLSITYHEKQKEAIHAFFENDISIIVGGPGTGKTTLIKAMVDIFKQLYPFGNLIVAAPTGRAAKRINEICDVESKTIHSLLKWNKDNNTFVYDVENPLMYDAIIIDEFSMVDNALFASLLKASSRIKKIAILGDNNQLPSIKPGNLLNDLIDCHSIHVTRLEYNYRQSEGNEIILLANDIRNGDVDTDRYEKDIQFYDIYRDHFDLISLIDQDIKEGYSLDQIQLLAPMYKGNWGIDTLNVELQEAFNPAAYDKNEKRFGKFVFREGDKILQLKNRPGDDVFNGDIGILEDIDDKEKSLMVNYSGTYVFYPYEDLSDISLAYALSVHKAQGSEYQIVYFVFNRNNIHMLNKNLIYTAISRAKKKLVIIGTRQLFKEGLIKEMKRRNTGLKELLEHEK